MDKASIDLAIQAAWPPRTTAAIGSWTARLDAGVTRRPNSVLPHGDGAAPDDATLDAMLAEAVQVYREQGLVPWIQVTEAAWPPRLEERLAARGWETGIDRTLLLEAPAAAGRTGGEAFVERTPSSAWVDAWWGVDPRGGPPELAVCLAVIGGAEQAAFARVVEGCHTLGVGMGVLTGEVVVLECVATVPTARRRGVATRVVGALTAWGAARGAVRALLAVQERNAAGRALYERLGFARVSSYAYARPPGTEDRKTT